MKLEFTEFQNNAQIPFFVLIKGIFYILQVP